MIRTLSCEVMSGNGSGSENGEICERMHRSLLEEYSATFLNGVYIQLRVVPVIELGSRHPMEL